MDFTERYNDWLEMVEQSLPVYIASVDSASGGRVYEAARYSLLAGGKRIRPILALATADMLNIKSDLIMPYACATEMIHTYSLIHDDLPCMDDDIMRRGKPTCHVVYGEAIAVLAGDLLLNRAYEVLIQELDPANKNARKAALIIAEAAGGNGMIGGQMLDLAGEDQEVSLKDLTRMHSMKTGALLKAPVLCAAALAGANQDIYNNLEQFASLTGLAFQIQDDILDTTADSSMLGKTTGKDQRDNKSTYVSLLGLDEAKKKLGQTTGRAQEYLKMLQVNAELDTGFLEQLTDYLLHRKK